ncbi:hypothetical protein ACOME3_003634 [Neoechinorhynchus agilis]
MSSIITYKFVADNNWDTISFDGDELNLHEFKRRVLIKQELTDFATTIELFVTDTESKYTYVSHKESLKAGSRVTIIRKPAKEGSLLVRILRPKKKIEPLIQIEPIVIDINNNEMSETYKKYLDAQAGNKFWATALEKHSLGDRAVCETRYPRKKEEPVNPHSLAAQPGNEEILNATANLRFRLQQNASSSKISSSAAVPSGSYVCHRCNRPGHFKHLCPMILEPMMNNELLPKSIPPINEIKRATGIPRSELIELKNFVPGCYMTTYGAYAIPRREAEVIFHPTKRRQDRESDDEDERPEDLMELGCGMCWQLMDLATMMNCCGATYCRTCLHRHIITHGSCPDCGTKEKDVEDMEPNVIARAIINDYKQLETDWIDETWKGPSKVLPQRTISDDGEESRTVEMPDLSAYQDQIDQMAGVLRQLIQGNSGIDVDELYSLILSTVTVPQKLTKRQFQQQKLIMKVLKDFKAGTKSPGMGTVVETLMSFLEYNSEAYRPSRRRSPRRYSRRRSSYRRRSRRRSASIMVTRTSRHSDLKRRRSNSKSSLDANGRSVSMKRERTKTTSKDRIRDAVKQTRNKSPAKEKSVVGGRRSIESSIRIRRSRSVRRRRRSSPNSKSPNRKLRRSSPIRRRSRTLENSSRIVRRSPSPPLRRRRSRTLETPTRIVRRSPPLPLRRRRSRTLENPTRIVRRSPSPPLRRRRSRTREPFYRRIRRSPVMRKRRSPIRDLNIKRIRRSRSQRRNFRFSPPSPRRSSIRKRESISRTLSSTTSIRRRNSPPRRPLEFNRRRSPIRHRPSRMRTNVSSYGRFNERSQRVPTRSISREKRRSVSSSRRPKLQSVVVKQAANQCKQDQPLQPNEKHEAEKKDFLPPTCGRVKISPILFPESQSKKDDIKPQANSRRHRTETRISRRGLDNSITRKRRLADEHLENMRRDRHSKRQ